MKAKCTQCGKAWKISIRKSTQALKRYVCPHCSYDSKKNKKYLKKEIRTWNLK